MMVEGDQMESGLIARAVCSLYISSFVQTSNSDQRIASFGLCTTNKFQPKKSESEFVFQIILEQGPFL
jgi:hypothetical protein